MKMIRLLALTLAVVTASMINGQVFQTTYDKSCADYWLDKMSDPNVNYHRLVAEFDQYWAGKTPDKNSGYKLFKRWQHANFPYVKPDGYLLPPDHDIAEYNKFLLQNPGEGITGTWDLVGPTIFPQQYYSNQCPGLGRVSALAFHPTNPDILFAGAPVGGLWKTVDGGDNWFNLNTDGIHTMGVSSIAVDFTNPNIIYFGSGDRDGSESLGLGVFKSVDGGLSWTQKNSGMGNKTVSKLLMFPDDHNSLLAAASDGVYLTGDGGNNWTKVRPSSKSVKELVFKPGDPQYIYAAREGDIYRSTDRGLTWILTKHTPAHRIVLAVTPANPEKLYALATLDSKFYRL
ncbi:MAG: hypothetical protein JW861_13715, partial [Bacteroidales bacterium]|nr:hypothetical protein [Bacteroidales bacterium]